MSLLRLYHQLPSWARDAAANAYGRRLRDRRYGPETEPLVAEALDRERWPNDQLRAWSEERLAEALDHAARHTPYYRELWSARRRKGDRRSWERLEYWPILDKASVRRHGSNAFLADDREGPLYPDSTSGTTGAPLRLLRSLRTLRARYALYEARHRRWYGVSRGDRWAMAGGRLVVDRERTRPPYWVWSHALGQLYVSSYHLAPAQARATLAEMTRRACRYVWGYPSSLDALARAALAAPQTAPRLAVAITNAEPLLAAQRERIERAFRCPVRETYGMVELVAAAGECEAGELHLFPEMGWTEILDPAGEPASAAGDLVATSLLDRDMPLVRYRTGDRAAPGRGACSCGRTLPQLGGVEGRADDVLLSADGRPVGRLDPVFKSDWRFREAQIVQRPSGDLLVRVAPEGEFSDRDARRLATELRRRLGDLDIRFEPVAAIPRGSNGKFRSVIRENPSERSVPALSSRHVDFDPHPLPQ